MRGLDLGKLATLKQKLVEATRFNEVNDYFYDEFAERPEFLDLGEAIEDATLNDLLLDVSRRVAGPGAQLGQVMLFRLVGHGFVHGAFTYGKRMGSMFYFEDIERGMVALGDMAGNTQLMRFSVLRTAQGRSFAIN